MATAQEAATKALVIEAFDTLSNRRGYAVAERFCSPDHIQHSAQISPGRGGLFDLIRNAPPTLCYEHGVILAEGEHVMVHGRFSGNGRPTAWIAVDVLRIVDACSLSVGTCSRMKRRP
ncbi:putative SnoaL-like aldol condensation-catalyzing enzyme [Novosphingobium sp. PhB165]|uniref:nuclear transport factor 2 family protein n=1 Tax=Novosphingobium sp. PhB165 TaxID=2485105 RepID=UPI0010D8516D|nr:hypothetical protein [Novosphingobium sp. PhB165]TCM14233.1 putative SnoaL-like aldol condensation-catalyzing enzyme [Novosphingobium sp. PhB165]